MSLRSPLGKVLGLGAAKEGSEHWWIQRLSSVALALLSLWLIVALFVLGDLSYSALHDWMGKPVNAALMVLLVGSLLYHSQLGVQVVLEDYIGHKAARVAMLVINQYAHVALGAIAVFAVLRVAFGGAA